MEHDIQAWIGGCGEKLSGSGSGDPMDSVAHESRKLRDRVTAEYLQPTQSRIPFVCPNPQHLDCLSSPVRTKGTPAGRRKSHFQHAQPPSTPRHFRTATRTSCVFLSATSRRDRSPASRTLSAHTMATPVPIAIMTLVW